jgi:hypothetical protein
VQRDRPATGSAAGANPRVGRLDGAALIPSVIQFGGGLSVGIFGVSVGAAGLVAVQAAEEEPQSVRKEEKP